MSEPTTAEMIAWLEAEADDCDKVAHDSRVFEDLGDAEQMGADAAMLRAIAARLRQASGKAEPLAGRPRSAPTQHWSVTVRRNGEEVVTIESNCLSGRELNAEDEDAIRTAGTHLLAFVGEPALTPSTGKAEPAPTYDAQPPGLTVLAPKRPVE